MIFSAKGISNIIVNIINLFNLPEKFKMVDLIVSIVYRKPATFPTCA